MDPTAALAAMRDAWATGNREEAHWLAADLADWLYKGGFEPDGIGRHDCLSECHAILNSTLDLV